MRKIARSLLIPLALLATACGGDGSTSPDAAPTGHHTVTMGDESSFYLEATGQSSDGKTLKVAQVVFTGSRGYVAIHSDANGAPGPVIGVSALLPQGESTNVTITLTQPLTTTANVWPMLHLEDNGNTTYDFPNGDAPAKVNNQIVMAQITVEVA